MADILTKVLQKCSLSSPVRNISFLSKSLNCHGNRKVKFAIFFSKIVSSEAIRGIKLRIIKRHETELKWIKLLQTPFPLGFNDNIYHEGNISKMPDFDVFSLLEIRKRKSRSHGIRKKGNGKRKKRAVKRSNTSLKDLSKVLEDHGRHSMLSFLSSLPISVLRILDTEANKFYDRNHQLYDVALLTRCYTQHALRPFIDSEINHKRHFIKIPFINKGIEFIDLPSIFKDRSRYFIDTCLFPKFWTTNNLL